MAGRRILNEQEARRCLAAAGAVRGSLPAWARSHGIDGRSLNAWRVNLERRGVHRHGPRVAPKLVELVPATAAMSSARYVLQIAGVGLEFADDFNEQTLRRLAGLLRSC